MNMTNDLLNSQTEPDPELPRYRPSGRIETTGIAKFVAVGTMLAVLLGWIYANLTSVTWSVPGTLIAAAFAAVVVSVTATILVKRAKSRSSKFNALACGAFGLLVVLVKWWFTFAEIGGSQAAWVLLTSGPFAWLAAIASLAQKLHFDTAHHPSVLGLLVTWCIEFAVVISMSSMLGKSETKEPFSESEGEWARSAFTSELFEPGGASINFLERLRAEGAPLVFRMLNARELQATPISAQWWTLKVAAKWVEADPTARWLDLTIIVHTRDPNGKVSSKQEATLMHWHVDDKVFKHLRMHATPAAASAPAPATAQVAPAPTPIELQPAVAALEAAQFSLALSLAKPHVQHPLLNVKADALRLCALAFSSQGDWEHAFDHFHQLFSIEPTAMNAMQAATTSVCAGELVRGQAWFEQAERLNSERHEMAPPELHTRFISALEQAGETAACMPHLEWLASAYKLHVSTDSHLLWMKGLPFFNVFLEKAFNVLSQTLDDQAIGAWYLSLRDAVDEDGKVQVDSILTTKLQRS